LLTCQRFFSLQGERHPFRCHFFSSHGERHPFRYHFFFRDTVRNTLFPVTFFWPPFSLPFHSFQLHLHSFLCPFTFTRFFALSPSIFSLPLHPHPFLCPFAFTLFFALSPSPFSFTSLLQSPHSLFRDNSSSK
jgi:hypothetical protein